MKWLDYIRQDDAELMVLPKALLEAAQGLEATEVAPLCKRLDSENVSAEHLRQLLASRRRWQAWKDAVAQASLNLPAEIWDLTHTPAQVDAFARAFRFFSSAPSSPPDEAAWLALRKIWDGAFGVAYKEAQLTFAAPDTQHPRFDHYAELLGKQDDLDEVAPHRWLAARRGAQEGVLEIRFSWRTKSMEPQVALHRSALGPAAHERSDASLLQELVLQSLDTWLSAHLDQNAQQAAMHAAAQSYRSLLQTEAVQTAPLVAIYVGHPRSDLGIVWLDEDGSPRKEETLPPEPHAVDELKHMLSQDPATAIVLPLRAADLKRLQTLERELHGIAPIHRIREAGLSKAREKWTTKPHAHSRETASAIVLGHRAQRPTQEWSRIDPVHLGLAEYQEMLDETTLRQVLRDEQALLQHHQSTKPTLQTAFKQSAPTKALAQRNPLLKTFDDLRPGMTLRGLVANLTDFGAFVHLGIPEEGLVHLSELADRFVRHPSEVVSVGQEVNVRVLNVDKAQKRISLSMRSQNKPRPKSQNQRKAQALKNLENLFKN